jgi:hypothetical protein
MGSEQARDGLRAFGLSLRVADPPPGAWARQHCIEPSLDLHVVEPAVVATSWSGLASIGWQATIDGTSFAVERGWAGDYRFVHGERSVCHLSVDGKTLQCAPNGDAGPVCWRVVLDSVLFSVALIHGHEALHAGAVVTPTGAVAVAAGAGGGKSTLLTELIRRGHALLSDDVVVLEHMPKGPLLAHPGPPLMTVPAQAAADLGATIASIADERWVAVPTYAEAAPLAALVLLDRRPGLCTELVKVRAPLVPLLGALLAFPREPERERARFELAGALASHTMVWRLTAHPDTEPQTLADLVLSGLPTFTPGASLP